MIHYYRSIGAFFENGKGDGMTYALYRDRWTSSAHTVKPKRLVLEEINNTDEDVETIYGSLPYYWDIAQ